MPPDAPRFGAPSAGFPCVQIQNLTLRCQLRYPLIAYEINAQGWNKSLGLEGVGGGCNLKIVIAKGGGTQFLYVIIIIFLLLLLLFLPFFLVIFGFSLVHRHSVLFRT